MNRDEAVATDPAQSVVVVACAGSGKTRLLVNRVVRLLESGAKPGEILAVTFTRKAAAEIRGRALESLREKNSDIRRRILLAESPEDALVVSTFHGWFLSLAALRPWSDSRRDPPRVGDDNNEPLLNEAWRNWLESESDSDAARELANFITPGAARLLLRKFAQNAAPWRLRERLCGNFEKSAGAENEAERIMKERLRESAKRFARLAKGRGKILESAVRAAERFASGDIESGELRAAFLTAKNERRARLVAEDDSLTEETVAALLDHLDAEQAARAAVFSRAALSAGAAFMRELDAVKARRHLAGFDDLEFSAWEALADPDGGEAAALRYRLDCKYRHILIDEFQDTSPTQWQVMRAWLEDAHGSDESPSVFIVGDPRQSVYHFRGGDPRLLDSAAKFLRGHYNAKVIRQNTCRRCAPQILRAVNAVFEAAENFVPHEFPEAKNETAGRVEWKVFEKSAPSESDSESAPMRNPLTRRPGESEDAARAHWAEHIAETVATVLRDWKIGSRPARPEDILILLRQFTHAGILLEKMTARGIRCASGGAFLNSFECADLLALASFLAAPARDLQLARALKSPIFSLSDDDLRDIALRSRDEKDSDSKGSTKPESLWEKLQGCGNEVSPASARALRLLTRWRGLAETAHLPAHDLLSRICEEGEIVSRYLGAVSPALRNRVCENLHALADLALMMDGGRRPLLAQFLAGCARGEAEDRSPGGGGDGAAVLTTHKAKGLEAPVVILADANFSEGDSGGRGDSADILIDWHPDRAAPDSFAVRPRSLPRAWRDLAEREARAKVREDENILYVAMTRAKVALFLFALGDGGRGPAARFGLFEKLAALPGAQGDARGGWVGDSFAQPAGRESETTGPDSFAPMDAIPAGVEGAETAETVRGRILHQLVALLLSGFSRAEAARLVPAGTAGMGGMLAEAGRIADSPDLRKLLDGAEFEMESDFAEAGKIFRPDLVARKNGEVWVVDYKSGGAPPESHRRQLRRYARALGSARAAVLTAAGELRELEV